MNTKDVGKYYSQTQKRVE